MAVSSFPIAPPYFRAFLRSTSSEINAKKKMRDFPLSAAPPAESALVAAEPLTKEDLVRYLASGCKPEEKWRIGTEHEKFGFQTSDLRPITYEQISVLLNGLADRFGWDRVMERDNVIGLKKGIQNISLEAGGQVELSGAPVETLHQTCAEIASHLNQVKYVAKEMGIGFMGIGSQPKWSLQEIPIMPKRRCEIMNNYMPKVGCFGVDLMLGTCTVQVNLDFSSELDMIQKFRASLALQPIATAIFANSPFTEGKPNGFLTIFGLVLITVGQGCFLLFSKTRLDLTSTLNMLSMYRCILCIVTRDISIVPECPSGDFMAGKLARIPGEYPTLNDWENHLTTIFPEVRLKRYLEMRGADGGSFERLCALPAFWVGLLYDKISLQSVTDMVSDWTEEERQMLRDKVPETGLKTLFREEFLQNVARDVLELAKAGLDRRGYGESMILKEVVEIVNTGVTPAEKLLELYHGAWGGNVDRVFEELLY